MSALLAAQAFAGLRQVWLLYALAAVQAALDQLDRPARPGAPSRPGCCPPRCCPPGWPSTSSRFQATLVAGPALAGLITAAGGLRLCYLIDAVSFAAAHLRGGPPARHAARRAAPARPRPARRGRRASGSSSPAGPWPARSWPTSAAPCSGFPFALFPAINAERFGGSPATLGLLTTAVGVGGLLGSVFSGPVGRIVRPGRGHAGHHQRVSGAAVAGFGAARHLWLALACLAVAGAADTTTVVLRAIDRADRHPR